MFSKIRILPQNSQFGQKCIFLEIRSKVKNHHISEAGVGFKIKFGLRIKIWAGENIFYIWQQTIALNATTLVPGC